MLVLINKILINLTEVLAITFKNPNTVCIADINKTYWEREYPTSEDAQKAYKTLYRKINYPDKPTRLSSMKN